jgi:hypothetical protein
MIFLAGEQNRADDTGSIPPSTSEAVNGLLQLAKRLARGFRSLRYFRIMAYLKAAGLHLNLPSLKPALVTHSK